MTDRRLSVQWMEMNEQTCVSTGQVEQGDCQKAITAGSEAPPIITGKGAYAKMAAQKLRASYIYPPPVKDARWIPLSQGMFALVDQSDFELTNQKIWTVVINKTVNYALFRNQITKETVFLHNWLLDLPDWVVADHRNFDGLDCRRENLRICSSENNKRHTRKWRTPTSSKFKGVCLHKISGKWTAQITNGGKIHLGSFSSEIEAARAYDIAAKERFGEFAVLNFQCA